MGSIKLPVKCKVEASFWEEESLPTTDSHFGVSFQVVERTYSDIEQLVDKIYERYHDELAEGNEPTYLAISKIDYEFINAYYSYMIAPAPLFHVGVENVYGKIRKVKTIFGLKIIITTSDLFRLGWEP